MMPRAKVQNLDSPKGCNEMGRAPEIKGAQRQTQQQFRNESSPPRAPVGIQHSLRQPLAPGAAPWLPPLQTRRPSQLHGRVEEINRVLQRVDEGVNLRVQAGRSSSRPGVRALLEEGCFLSSAAGRQRRQRDGAAKRRGDPSRPPTSAVVL